MIFKYVVSVSEDGTIAATKHGIVEAEGIEDAIDEVNLYYRRLPYCEIEYVGRETVIEF